MSVIRKAVRRIRRLTKRSLDCKCDDASVTEWLLIRSSFHPCLHRYQAAINRLWEVRFLRSLGTSVEAQDEPPEQNNFVQTQKSNSETALNVASRKAERFHVARSTRRRWKTQTKLYFSVQTDPGLGGGGHTLRLYFCTLNHSSVLRGRWLDGFSAQWLLIGVNRTLCVPWIPEKVSNVA